MFDPVPRHQQVDVGERPEQRVGVGGMRQDHASLDDALQVLQGRRQPGAHLPAARPGRPRRRAGSAGGPRCGRRSSPSPPARWLRTGPRVPGRAPRPGGRATPRGAGARRPAGRPGRSPAARGRSAASRSHRQPGADQGLGELEDVGLDGRDVGARALGQAARPRPRSVLRRRSRTARARCRSAVRPGRSHHRRSPAGLAPAAEWRSAPGGAGPRAPGPATPPRPGH